MKRNYTFNLFYVLCVVIVLAVYPAKNYSAIVNFKSLAKSGNKSEKPAAQQIVETLQNDFLFKY